MALTTTTLASAMTQTDTIANLTSATGVQAGMIARVNGEWMKVAQNYVSGTAVLMLRGQDGSQQVAQGVTSNFTFGVASDFAIQPPAGVPSGVTTPVQPAFPIKAYGAAGAIDVRQHMGIINGTNALAMTLANPTKDMDAQILIVVSNGKAAHTLTYTAGLGNGGASYDVLTYTTGALNAVMLIACNGFWVGLSTLTGTLTSIFPAIA